MPSFEAVFLYEDHLISLPQFLICKLDIIVHLLDPLPLLKL